MPSSERSAPEGTRFGWQDVVGIACLVVAAVAVLAPALRPGVSLGPFDLLSRVGLTARPGVQVHSAFPADQALYFLPMTSLAWHQVHAGHVPLWNPYNVLGTPLAFNWQSGVFSLPTLVAYLLPLRYAYAAIVLVKLVVAGTGVYVLCRVLRLGPMAAVFGGLAFELSGPIVNYAGWAMTGVTSWGGWILAFGVLVVRGHHRARHGALLALCVAFAIYGGHPESVLVLAVSATVFFAVLLWRRRPRSWRGAGGAAVALGLSAVAGLLLATPLVLPGLQLVGQSSRASSSGAPVYSLSHLPNLVVALHGSDFRTPPPYLGVITVVLAAVALRTRWRQPPVLALGAMGLVALLLTFQNPLYTLFDGFPKVRAISWDREAMLLALAVAVLGAVGVEELIRSTRRSTVLRVAAGGLVVVALVLAGTGAAVATGALHVQGGQATAFAWPAGEVGGGLVLVGLLATAGRHRRGGRFLGRRGVLVGGLVALQGAALVFTGVSSWSISSAFFPTTEAVGALQSAVGEGLVARGSCQPLPFTMNSGAETGIRPNANIAYGVREFAAYEPVLPHAYFRSWAEVSGQAAPKYLQRVGVFCPVVTSAAEARIFGVSFVLTGKGGRGPTGAVAAGTVGGERLYRIPGSAEATMVTHTDGAEPSIETPGSPVAVAHPDAATWRLETDGTAPSLLRLRLTALPGWRASLDGQPLALRSWAGGALLEADVPAGRHAVTVRYWPPLFTAGLWLALATGVCLVAVLVVSVLRRRAPRPARSR